MVGITSYGAYVPLYRLSREKQKPDPKREPDYQERNWDRIQERQIRMDRRFDPRVDRAFWRQFILNYAATPVDQHVAAFDAWFELEGSAADEVAVYLDGGSRLGVHFHLPAAKEMHVTALQVLTNEPSEVQPDEIQKAAGVEDCHVKQAVVGPGVGHEPHLPGVAG